MSQVTIVTATYNRPEMFAECAAAVLAQSFKDWTWWVVFNGMSLDFRYDPDVVAQADPRIVPIWYPVSESQRARCHVPSRIVNWLYPKVTTPYIYWLSDDDLIDPDGLAELVDAIRPLRDWNGDVIQAHKPPDAVYGCCQVVDQQPDGSYKQGSWCYPGDPISTPPGEGWDVGMETGVDPHCLLDGGQVLHTKALWDRATADGWQQTDALDTAASQDGLLLRRLAQFARFHFVPTKIVTHRRHAGATFHKPQQ